MQSGFSDTFNPTQKQSSKLSQWIGCARVIWNAKYDESRYLRCFAKKYLPVGTYPPNDKEFARYKDDKLTPWLSDCPSQVLRQAAYQFATTTSKAIKGECGFPRRKNRVKGNYVWLTNDMFSMEYSDYGCRLWIGSAANKERYDALTKEMSAVDAELSILAMKEQSKDVDRAIKKAKKHRAKLIVKLTDIDNDPQIVGYIAVRKHHKFKAMPNSLWIKRTGHEWRVAFSFEDGTAKPKSQEQVLEELRAMSHDALDLCVRGVDRNVGRAVQTDQQHFVLDEKAKAKIAKKEAGLKRHQKQLARQKKGSNASKKIKKKISKLHRDIANIRENFAHQTTSGVLGDPATLAIILEDLRVLAMTKSAKAKQDPKTGKWLRNGAAAKSGLNKAFLSSTPGMIKTFFFYKAHRLGKLVALVNPRFTSQECAKCGHIHEDNRHGDLFLCTKCGHRDNADHNAAVVIKKRGIALIKDPGTGLSSTGKLVPKETLGEGGMEGAKAPGKPKSHLCKTTSKANASVGRKRKAATTASAKEDRENGLAVSPSSKANADSQVCNRPPMLGADMEARPFMGG